MTLLMNPAPKPLTVVRRPRLSNSVADAIHNGEWDEFYLREQVNAQCNQWARELTELADLFEDADEVVNLPVYERLREIAEAMKK